MLRCSAVLGAVHRFLFMLDARADGEGLLLHGHARRIEHLEGIPGAVADGQHQLLRRLDCAADLRADELSALEAQARELRLEAHLAAQPQDLQPQVLHHRAQVIRADVGLGLIQNLLRRAHAHEGLQHLPAAGILDAGVELAVRERARAALAELHVAGRIEGSARPEALHVLRAGIHVPAPLDHQRLEPRLGQMQRREQPRRAHAHHDGPVCAGPESRHGLRRLHIGQELGVSRQVGGPAPHLHVQREGEVHVPLVPRVHRLFEDARGDDFLRAQLQRPRSELHRRTLGIIQIYAKLRQAYHILSPVAQRRGASPSAALYFSFRPCG